MVNVYVTIAYRWGDHQGHSYIVGVYETKERAKLAGEVEETWRGRKYECEVQEFPLDSIDAEQLFYHKIYGIP